MSPQPERVKILRRGTRVSKIGSEPSDFHGDGSRGTVCAHVGPVLDEHGDVLVGYYVEWDEHPGAQVFIGGSRVREVSE